MTKDAISTTSTPTTTKKTTQLANLLIPKGMALKLWPTPQSQTSIQDDATPKAEPRENPFEVSSRSPAGPGNQTPTITSYHHHLLNKHQPLPAASAQVPSAFAAALPTTAVSLNAPDFNMKQPPALHTTVKIPSPSTSTSNGSVASNGSSNSPVPGPSRGQIHVKLLQARALNVCSPHAQPYVVVQFEQNEFVSRDPTHETEREVKGTATNLSKPPTSTAISALGRAAEALIPKRKQPSANSTPVSSVGRSSALSGATSGNTTVSTTKNGALAPPSSGINQSLLSQGGLSPHNPVWKHEVSFDVTSESSSITFNVYDRCLEEHSFLGTLQIKPLLVHDHTVDQWYPLRPYENEEVSGDMRVQITYEQYKTKRALTPRDFEFLKLIGRGTFGKVFQVRKRDTKRIYAMKVLSKKEIVAKKEVAHTIGERKILQRSLESPFLVGLKFSFQTDTDLYLITDFKSGGELFWHLQKETRFTEERARFYIAELVLALEHLHKFDIVYRDLKPENILLDATGHVALCDFGLSKADLRSDELTTTFCGTTEYLAPEVLLDEHGYSKLVDFWSLGVLLFEMCCGWSPFYAEDTQQMYKNICFGKIRFPKGVIGEDGKQFVKGLLNRNPKHRLGALSDAAELKQHAFFKSIDWKALALKQVTPPFKPVVESDESTANFDTEFTSADIRDIGLAGLILDEEDPSEDWTQTAVNVGSHTPNGPLGSEKSPHISPSASTAGGFAVAANPMNNPSLNGAALPRPGASSIQIQTKKKKTNAAGSPLTNSVQENFRGFTYSGGESVVTPSGIISRSGSRDSQDNEEAVSDDEAEQPSTEEELESSEAGGRYANARRNGTHDDEMPL